MRDQKPQGTAYHECCQRRNVFDVVLALQSTVCLHTFFSFGPLVHPTLAVFIVCGPSSCSLRVAVPTPRGKTGGRERLRKAGTNRVSLPLCRSLFGHSTFLVASLVFMKGASFCVIGRNVK